MINSRTLLLITIFLFMPSLVLAGDDAYFFALGEVYYQEGRYEEALDEFALAIAHNPDNRQALSYIERIAVNLVGTEQEPESVSLPPAHRKRQVAIDSAFEQLAQKRSAAIPQYDWTEEIDEDIEVVPADKTDNVSVHGEVYLGAGFTTEDAIWKRANFDLNERNFRLLSDNQLNNKENTFDPGVYDRLRLDVDAGNEDSSVAFHTNISIDPWSFVGKTDKVTVTGAGGDTVELEVLYWSNTGYTVNQIFFTLENGDSFALPELKVQDGRVPATTVTSTFGNTFTIPELDINRQFQPIRELWVDLTPNQRTKFRVFPIAYGDMALTSNDPLRVSNNHTYWEESPWLQDWRPGHFNSGAGDFFKGEWDDALAFFTRDSDGIRLTALRGIALDYVPSDSTSVAAVIASPKDLWQDYERVRAVPASVRVKSFLTDNFYLGNTTNLHLGFADAERDAYNFVSGLDAGLSPWDGFKIEGQVSTSLSEQDLTNETFATKERGNAYYFGITQTSLQDSELLEGDYFAVRPKEPARDYHKTRFFWARMDERFQSTLSSYRETRDDSYWSRHLNFRPPLDPFFRGGSDGLSLYDLEPFAIGSGIDIGRYVFGWRTDMSFAEGDLVGLIDVRNVHRTNNKYLETVARTEWAHNTTDRLTTKLLLLRHDLPKTKGGIDPFIVDSATDDFLINAAIPDGEDPSLNTASLGAQYRLTDWMTAHGIWEYTNDFTVATDNFPRGLFNDSSFTTFTENGQTFRQQLPFLYNQGFFDLPPYEYHSIFKTGLLLTPDERWNIYLDYTRNPFEYAGQIDDNINHVGFEVSYLPTERLGLRSKYVWSRWNDINRVLNDGEVVFESHHNFFVEVRYNIRENENFRLQYGVGSSPAISSSTVDPFGGALLTLDTQHILRLFYQKTF
jgi:hypothetical protein